MKKLPLLLLCALLLLQTACSGCQPHDATTRNHGKGCNLTLKAVKEAGTINGYPVYGISGRLENDHTAPKETIIGAIFDPTTDKTGKSIAVKDIAEKEPQTPKTNQKGQKSVLAQANEVVKLEQNTLVSYEGAKERVVKKGDVHFIASFVGKDTLQPNTKYAIDLFAAEPRRATGARNAVYTSTQSLQCTTPDFSENASRKVRLTKVERDARAVELTFKCEANGKDMPTNGVAFFLLVKKSSDNLKQDVFKALERLILNDHKLSDGTDLQSLSAAAFKLVDPAQPTEGALYPLGTTAAGDSKLANLAPMTDVDRVIPKDGGKYWATVLVYEPEGKYTVSTGKCADESTDESADESAEGCTVEVPEAAADLSVEKAKINELVVDVSGKAVVQSFQLGVKGSMKNPKGIVKPRFYFVFHKSKDPTASEQELKGIVNQDGVAKTAVATWWADASNPTEHNWVVYPAYDSAAGNTDETVDRTNKNALNDPKIPLALGETYQIYLAIKDNRGTGGTTLVGQASAKLEIPNVAIAFENMAKGEKQFKKLYGKHIITTRASISNVKFLNGAKTGLLFTEKGDRVNMDDMQRIAKDWRYTQKEIANKVKDKDLKIKKYAIDKLHDGNKVFQRDVEANKHFPSAFTTNLTKGDYSGIFKPNTHYFPACWLCKGNSIFYASAPTRIFTTGNPFPDSGNMPDVLRHGGKTYHYYKGRKLLFLIHSDSSSTRLDKKSDETDIRKIFQGQCGKEAVDQIIKDLALQ